MRGKKRPEPPVIDRQYFISQFVLLSQNLLKLHLPEQATETEFMEASRLLLGTKFRDALGVLNAKRQSI